MARFAVLAVAALVAVAAVSCAAAAPPPEEAYFADWMAASSASSAKARAADPKIKAKGQGAGYEREGEYAEERHEGYGHVDVKHVCLAEQKLRDCRTTGCQNVQNCCSGTDSVGGVENTCQNPSPDGCTDCITNAIAVSDLYCCGGDDPYGYHDYHGAWASPTTIVGSCDWDVNLYKSTSTSTAANTYAPIQIPNKDTWKIGTAWATCTLYDTAESCGAPLCDKMVLSFQGGIYFTGANSRTANTTNTNDDQECQDLFDGLSGGFDPLPVPNITRSAGSAPRLPRGLIPKLLRSTGLANRLGGHAAEIKSAEEAEPTYYRGGVRVSPDTGYYVGAALVISGPFTVTSLEHETEFERGLLEFTPRFTTFLPAGAKHQGWPVLRPSAVKLRFVKNSGGKQY